MGDTVQKYEPWKLKSHFDLYVLLIFIFYNMYVCVYVCKRECGSNLYIGLTHILIWRMISTPIHNHAHTIYIYITKIKY